VTAYPNWTAGEIVTDTKLDLYTTNLEAICILNDASQTLTDSVAAAITFDTETLDPRGWHSASGSTVTPDIAGYYQVTAASGIITATSTVVRFLGRVLKNGAIQSPYLCDVTPTTGVVSMEATGSGVHTLVMNGTSDTIALQVYQDSDTNRSVISQMTVRLIYPT
jgi:hypothetical protein